MEVPGGRSVVGIVTKDYYLFYCDECSSQAKGVRANPTRIPWRLDPRVPEPQTAGEIRLLCDRCASKLGYADRDDESRHADKMVLEKIFGRRDW